MATIILVAHIMIAMALVAVVLLQRSEGGALGMGGSSGGLMSGRGMGNALTRATAILAALFFATSLGLGIIASRSGNGSVLDQVVPASTAPAGNGVQIAPAPLVPAPPSTGGATTPTAPVSLTVPPPPAVPSAK